MDFNAMINKLLKSASESRRRQLCEHPFSSENSGFGSWSELILDIRTYAVMPLNEECGLLEWVANTHALKNILEKGYNRQGKRIWVSHQSTAKKGTKI
jgi:serine/threonine-protein kinase ATR